MNDNCLADFYADAWAARPTIAQLPGDSLHTLKRPFVSRPLLRRERRDEDLHAFRSPKENRLVEAIGVPALCLALLNEFNPQIIAYIERPRVLQTADACIELTAWVRDCLGREHFLLIVPNSESQPAQGGRRSHREALALQDAAARADIRLIFVTEAELLDQRLRITQALRLLPYVQDAQRQANRLYLRERVLEVLSVPGHAPISQIEQSLKEFIASDVRAVVCDLLHLGELQMDAQASLTFHTVVGLRSQHGYR